jgi:prophage maintenance system killer protein
MAKKNIRYMDLASLVEVNKKVVGLTGEPSEYSPADRAKLENLLGEVEARANNQELEEAVPEKAALLVFKVASGQYFRAGNKRTALVAGAAFARKNGYVVDMTNHQFVSTVDKVGVAAATLDDLFGVMSGLMTKSAADRKGWDNAIKEIVDSNRKFLTELGA